MRRLSSPSWPAMKVSACIGVAGLAQLPHPIRARASEATAISPRHIDAISRVCLRTLRGAGIFSVSGQRLDDVAGARRALQSPTVATWPPPPQRLRSTAQDELSGPAGRASAATPSTRNPRWPSWGRRATRVPCRWRCGEMLFRAAAEPSCCFSETAREEHRTWSRPWGNSRFRRAPATSSRDAFT